MLKFYEQIIGDLLEDPSGGLVILSGGLGLSKLISYLLHLHHPSQGSLLILSASPSQKSSILRNYRNTLNHETPISTSEITFDLPAQQRISLYGSGGIFFVTTRILIVDLLTHRLPTTAVAGILLLNAHSLSDTSTEAFIVRILRSSSRSLYVRAFSDRPHAMVSGFAKAERTLKCLFLRKLHLWPRFQVHVSQDLERDPPEVVDIRVPMSPYMIVIQKAVIETLRKLLDYLARYDAVTYLKYLDSLRASESFRSVWIFSESSYKIFEYAKKRVYYFGRSDGGKSVVPSKTASTKKRKLEKNKKSEDDSSASANSGLVLEEVLEEPPKWKVLRDILEEIQEEREKQVSSREEPIIEGETECNGIVLVACKDEHSCMQLEDCIKKGAHKVMREEWEKYLLSKVELQSLPKSNKKKPKAPKGFGVLDGVVPTISGQTAEVSSISKQENDALLAAALEIGKQAKKDVNAKDDVTCERHEKGRRKGSNKKKSEIGRIDCESETCNQSEMLSSDLEDERNYCNPSVAGHLLENAPQSEASDKGVLRKHGQGPESTKQLPPVHFFALESNQIILDILQPSAIIVYHPDIAFVREIEIYKAENPSKNLKVYFLFYEDSTEVRKFEASVLRENGAFESLIRQKSLMLIPVDQDAHFLGVKSSLEPQSITAQNLITRKAGGKKEAEKEMQVIVDMREFMSSLPNVLHQKGMHIIPVTLEVGDYILSPLICVERKSIQDLFGSFASGRLYHQVEMMSRYYRIPVLLIEFSQDKSFSFLSVSDIGDDVSPNSIISKLSLLVLHFSRLRIVWSRSLHATAEIFATLKANQDEPDEARAIRVGIPSEEGIVENDVRAENFNTSAVEFLRRLPGVTDSNYRSIMDECKSLAELALLPVERLAEVMGGQKAAKTLRDFLDAKYPTLL
ncbi:DNA repair endonuclease UVH1 [Forsythia ovata]|uniref:DNA repair endonuclease UVH1 n=1 Tax=Forsythia ovata TaxID=205694 RepID=A0ABD1WEJ5_9LAMI